MQIIQDRRALHQIPELDRDLPETMAYLSDRLAPLSCQTFSPMTGALCAWFDFGCREAIAFRSDADALPIDEKSDVPYRSCHPGKMHACGHDGHMAMMLELARRLSGRSGMRYNVLLVFQPAEETTGGAKDLCETGIFEKHNVCAIFGMHLWPTLAEGVVASRCNEMMSRSCEVKVDVYGKSAHIAKPHEGIDALKAAVDFYSQVMALVAALPASTYRLMNFGKFQSGTVCNAISGHTRLEGSLRTFQDDVFFGLRSGIQDIARNVEESSGCTIDVHLGEGYPAVMNPPELYERVRKAVDFAELEAPSMITEDFSWYQRRLPGVFFFLGTGDSPALHADHFDFREEILIQGADFLEKLAVNFQ